LFEWLLEQTGPAPEGARRSSHSSFEWLLELALGLDAGGQRVKPLFV